MTPRQKARVLFFSVMTISPVTGGGSAAVNALESAPEGSEVFYATPSVYPPRLAPLSELRSRICWFSNNNRPIPVLRGGGKIGTIRRLNTLISRSNDRLQTRAMVRDVVRCIQQRKIDVLLMCPQNDFDLAAAVEVVEKTGLPSVAWFMDDYYTNEASMSRVRELWKGSYHRFVASETMQESFSELYGGASEMLNNSVPFPERYSEPVSGSDSRLRIAYTGAINSYYLESMSAVLGELHGLNQEVSLDIYSPDELPSQWRSEQDVPWRHLPPVPKDGLIERLQEYDVVLLLSSFKPEHRKLAETSQAGKMADYLASGRCILAYGPEYADNVRYIRRYDLGETVTSQAPGVLREAVLSLARHPEHRQKLGKQAYQFGREHRDKKVYSARLWRALLQAPEASDVLQRKGVE